MDIPKSKVFCLHGMISLNLCWLQGVGDLSMGGWKPEGATKKFQLQIVPLCIPQNASDALAVDTRMYLTPNFDQVGISFRMIWNKLTISRGTSLMYKHSRDLVILSLWIDSPTFVLVTRHYDLSICGWKPERAFKKSSSSMIILINSKMWVMPLH
jgi:hypothetical protein